MKTEISCPACLQIITDGPIETWTASDAADHFVAPSRNANRNQRLIRVLEHLWVGKACEVYECPTCGFGFGWPHRSGGADFYKISHEQAGYPTSRWEYSIAANRASEVFPTGGMALDVGAGFGNFAKFLPRGWRFHAVESTPFMRSALQARGHRTFDTLDEAADAAPNSFSLIVLFQVIEHVAEFDAMLSTLRRLAAPGALLVISTPYGPDLPARFLATKCPDMPPNHINRWTSQALGKAVARAGFRLEVCKVQPAQVKNILYSAYLRTVSDAAHNRNSLAGFWYRIQDKRVRMFVAPFVGLVQLAKMLPQLRRATLSVNMLAYCRAV